MSILHCAAFNNHVAIAQFLHDTVDNYNMNQVDKVRTCVRVCVRVQRLFSVSDVLVAGCCCLGF